MAEGLRLGFCGVGLILVGGAQDMQPHSKHERRVSRLLLSVCGLSGTSFVLTEPSTE